MSEQEPTQPPLPRTGKVSMLNGKKIPVRPKKSLAPVAEPPQVLQEGDILKAKQRPEPIPDDKNKKKEDTGLKPREVQLGDVIRFHKHSVQSTLAFEYARFFSKNNEGLTWKERKFVTAKAQYRYWSFTYNDALGVEGHRVIYVQSNDREVWTRFWTMVRDGKEDQKDFYTLKVDDKFQYGQNSEGKGRYLVFHNRSHMPFQHRFKTSATEKYMDAVHAWVVEPADLVYGIVEGVMTGVVKSGIDIAKTAAGGLLTNAGIVYNAVLLTDKIFSLKTRLLATAGDYLRDFHSGEPKWFDPLNDAVACGDRIRVDLNAPTLMFVGDAVDSRAYYLLDIKNETRTANPHGFMMVQEEFFEELKGTIIDGTITVDGTFFYDRLSGYPPQRIVIYGKGKLFPQRCYSYAVNQVAYGGNDVDEAAEFVRLAEEDVMKATSFLKEAEAKATVAKNTHDRTNPKDPALETEAKQAAAIFKEAGKLHKNAEKTLQEAKKVVKVAQEAREKDKAQKALQAKKNADKGIVAKDILVDTVAKHVHGVNAKPLPRFAFPGVKIGDRIKLLRTVDDDVEINDVPGGTKYVLMEFENKEEERQPKFYVLWEKAKIVAIDYFQPQDKAADGYFNVPETFRSAAWSHDPGNRILIYQEGTKQNAAQTLYLNAVQSRTQPKESTEAKKKRSQSVAGRQSRTRKQNLVNRADDTSVNPPIQLVEPEPQSKIKPRKKSPTRSTDQSPTRASKKPSTKSTKKKLPTESIQEAQLN
ncbi:hypothetical protein OC846_006414 [Tilletia horrida]|uniref:Uncharacterized protein n=1 Tax=Tilletia horrida TaxID=155126 RepID=A0AAN6GLD5_9BASI|nr:hypothetical protein OC845_006418 [Tilletia horrida]KAK0543431.1 hypothetical protein OC846_006414 [Tilletia horrida]KAK0559849.1 hypothetical protein OC861_006508 [Tilletia horrida]